MARGLERDVGMNVTASASKGYLDGTIVRDGLQAILTQEGDHAAQIVADWVDRGLDHVFLVGCGGSWAIMEPVKWLLDRYSPLPADAYTAWEFVARAPRRVDGRAAAVLASHAGTTEEVLLGLDLARERGARTVGFSRPGTPLAERADSAMVYETPAVNLAKLLMGYLIAANLIVRTGDREAGERLLTNLATLPETLQRIKEATEPHGRALAKRHRDTKGYYLLGIGPLAGLAYQFQTCTLMEMQWRHASAINAGEFRHGPFEIIGPGVPVICLLGTDASRPVAERALAFAQRHGADTLVFDLAELPAIDPDLAHFAIHVALQWFAVALAEERNHPLSTRRYMWKVPY
jgi:fructoselysine 6-phosphate deglycase